MPQGVPAGVVRLNEETQPCVGHCGAVGVLLAVVAVVPMLWASGKLPAFQRRGQQPPPQQVVHEESFVLTERHYRLEEIKVELALLADRATFPYHLGARAAGETLELHGFVPNEQARQYAMTLASHSTFLRVCNKVQIQAALGVTSPRRPAPMLQEEAAELMEKNLGEPAQAMSIGVRPNGLIVVAGSIASAEKKLAVSRLFRKLSGCQGVVNELIVPPSPRDGPSVVQTTLKGSILQPPALLNAKPPARIAAPVNPKRAIPASPLPVPPAPLQPVAPARPLAVTVPAKTAAPVSPKRAIPAPLLPVPPAPLQPVARQPRPVAHGPCRSPFPPKPRTRRGTSFSRCPSRSSSIRPSRPCKPSGKSAYGSASRKPPTFWSNIAGSG